MNKKGNPVPQTETELIEQIHNMCFHQGVEKHNIAVLITKFRKGVETNNEKPIVHKDESTQSCDL